MTGIRTDKDTIAEHMAEEAMQDNQPRRHKRRLDPYERTRASVYATGNKWAIENFEATHN